MHQPELNNGSQLLYADASKLPFLPRSFDLVLATYSIPMWSRDPDEMLAAYSAMTSMVKTGGLLCIYPICVTSQHIDTAGYEYFHDMMQTAILGAAGIADSVEWQEQTSEVDGLKALRLS